MAIPPRHARLLALTICLDPKPMRRSLVLFLTLLAPAALAEDALVVQILCDANGRTSKGSGVIVSADGRVLTAAHVVPENASCRATLATTEGTALPLTPLQRAPGDLDAMLLQLGTAQPFPRFAKICTPRVEQEIIAFGFHGTARGTPSRKEGIIAKAEIQDGVMEITAPVVPAESGGPVFLRGTTSLVGVVKGAGFDRSGILVVRTMVPASELTSFGLTSASRCEPRETPISPDTQALIDSLRSELAARAEAAGLKDRLLVALARRIEADTETVDQALTELENAVEIPISVSQRGTIPSDAGPFVDEVLAEVARLTGAGELEAATRVVDQGLSQLDAAKAAIRTAEIDLLTSGIQTDLLRRDAEAAAARIVRRVKLEEPNPVEQFNALRSEQVIWYERGRDKGLNLDLEVAIALASATIERATDIDERGTGLNDLGNALQTLGSRESGTARLEEAVAAYRAALEERTRDRVPLDWADTHYNLALVKDDLFDRTNDTALLTSAIEDMEKAGLVYALGQYGHRVEDTKRAIADFRAKLPPN